MMVRQAPRPLVGSRRQPPVLPPDGLFSATVLFLVASLLAESWAGGEVVFRSTIGGFDPCPLPLLGTGGRPPRSPARAGLLLFGESRERRPRSSGRPCG